MVYLQSALFAVDVVGALQPLLNGACPDFCENALPASVLIGASAIGAIPTRSFRLMTGTAQRGSATTVRQARAN